MSPIEAAVEEAIAESPELQRVDAAARRTGTSLLHIVQEWRMIEDWLNDDNDRGHGARPTSGK